MITRTLSGKRSLSTKNCTVSSTLLLVCFCALRKKRGAKFTPPRAPKTMLHPAATAPSLPRCAFTKRKQPNHCLAAQDTCGKSDIGKGTHSFSHKKKEPSHRFLFGLQAKHVCRDWRTNRVHSQARADRPARAFVVQPGTSASGCEQVSNEPMTAVASLLSPHGATDLSTSNQETHVVGNDKKISLKGTQTQLGTQCKC